VDIHYAESQRLAVKIYLSHNLIMRIWPASQGFRVLLGAVRATLYRPTWTVYFGEKTGTHDLLEKVKNSLCFHQLFEASGHQLLKSRSVAARSVEHLQAG
jgi:hypothetical protein